MIIKGYEKCSKWLVTLNKEDFKTEEEYNKKCEEWKSQLLNCCKTVIIQDCNNEILLKGEMPT